MEGLDIKQMITMVHSIADEKNLSEDEVMQAVEAAIAAAWRRDNGTREMNVRAELNREDGTAKVIVHYDVVETPEGIGQITLEEAKKIDKKALLGGVIEQEFEAKSFGRVAAQTAKQVLLQKLREFERETMANEYGSKIGKIITGTVIRVESRVIRLDLGHGEGIMPGSEQIPGEHLVTGSRIRALLKNIDRDSNRGPTIILSRADAQFVKLLFLQEVPEIETGTVEIKAIAREAGRRTKIAVYSSSSDIDPVGTFVGTKGVRVQAVMNEIGDTEKIDIITYDHDIRNYIANALSPAEISRIDVNESDKTATVYVTEAQQSVAIGRQGQNVRLASQLTGYDIDIVTE
ncbi:transcription termination factor NusA [Candidatus Saccharibacteria bacterium]|jgi:transcription termination factor nusA|uniref:transcription termination factor NusA n=1 Tax=Candidatus Nanoperiomorbus periodonticus TaxID=2171989 RepID=UPI00101B690E|nr:transcription termination factor NusA [Candidatus Nanoperiomorbus periodonticus]MCG5079322.1 transcription termination factor NusA [Candidatus Saccharibacteria bacterium]MCG5106126.1 transcription termination factor NusA [Candidatus Saccharibacteria bacterium]RYC75978.1 Transcription termination/antitermination protein NusA [Candidatus Nanoperiomorbus periodonticus]